MKSKHPDKRFHILTINSGSSSIKFSLWSVAEIEDRLVSGEIKGIRESEGIFYVSDRGSKRPKEMHLRIKNHTMALKLLLEWLKKNAHQPDAVGHRIVHGGIKYSEPRIITNAIIKGLRKLSPFAPEHLPHELKAVEIVGQSYPDIKQVACFDTSFYHSMPRIARLYPLPSNFVKKGLLRYGFHGLSYEYIIDELHRKEGKDVANGRIIIAHLGHGASMTAIYEMQSVDTTMGFTPAGGLMMSTRTGDIDPGVILYLLEHKKMSPDEINELINRRSGLLGVSGISGDMKELLEKEDKDHRAKEAIELFCYQARKFLSGLVSVLGGLDTLIFTGGIGENSPSIRWRICNGMGFLGLYIDPALNRTNATVISKNDSIITVRVMKTDEEFIIARHTRKVLADNLKDKGGHHA